MSIVLGLIGCFIFGIICGGILVFKAAQGRYIDAKRKKFQRLARELETMVDDFKDTIKVLKEDGEI